MDNNQGADNWAELNLRVATLGGFGFFSKIFSRAITFGSQLLLTRHLGSSGYGLYQIGKSVVNLCAVFSRLGLNKGVVRYGSIARSEGDAELMSGTLTTGFVVAGGVSTAAALGLYLAADVVAKGLFGTPDLAPALRLFSMALPFTVLLVVGGAALQAFERIDYQEGTLSLVRPVLNLLGIGVALLLGYALTGVIVAFVLATVVSAMVGLAALYRVLRRHDFEVRPKLAQGKDLVRFSLPLVVVGTSYFLAIRTDRIMLGVLADASSVGLYSAAAVIAAQFGLVHTSLVAIFEPIITDAFTQDNHQEVERLYNMVKRWSAIGTFILVLPVTMFPEELLSIFGAEFVRGWHVILVLAVPYVFGSLVGPTGALLQMSGNQNIEFGNAIVMIVMNIALNYMFILKLGFIGAAIGTGLAHLLFNSLQLIELKYLFEFTIFDRHYLVFAGMTAVLLAGSITVSPSLRIPGKLVALIFVELIYLFVIYSTRTEEDELLISLVLD